MNKTYSTTNCKTPLKPLAACLALVLGNVSGNDAIAATLVVANCGDSGSGSLRDTITSAQSGDSIDLTHLNCGTITLATGTITIGVGSLALLGPGASVLTIMDHADQQNYNYSVFNHVGTGTLRIDSLHIAAPDSKGGAVSPENSCIYSAGSVDLNKSSVTGCNATGVYALGGFTATYSTISENHDVGVIARGNVSILNSTISDNEAGSCGGLLEPVYGSASATLISNSTISGNHGYYGSGGGCMSGPVTIANSTIAFNTSNYDGGGLQFSGSQIVLESSIFANNIGNSKPNDLELSNSTIVTGHNNLIMATDATVPADTIRGDPLLQPLADNGGLTQTHALASGSPAIDAGNNTAGLANDQRGAPYARVHGAHADIGAFEAQSAGPATFLIGPGITGNWYDTSESGHGFSLEVLPGNMLLAEWFVFAPQGGRDWIIATGPITGNIAVLTAWQSSGSGGRFPPNFNAAQVQQQAWGTLTFTFTDCSNGTASWQSTVAGYGAGSIPITRLTIPAGLTCP